MSEDKWTSKQGGFVPAPMDKPVVPATSDSGAPTPEEVAEEVAKKQAEIDSAKLPQTEFESESVHQISPAVEYTAVIGNEPPIYPQVTSGTQENEEPVVEEPVVEEPVVEEPVVEESPSAIEHAFSRPPKHRLDAFLKIPGGFSGRVVKIYPHLAAVESDPDVIEAGGIEAVLRGLQGRGVPTTPDQPFYRCRSNACNYDLVVGELDAHLIQQGPEEV